MKALSIIWTLLFPLSFILVNASKKTSIIKFGSFNPVPVSSPSVLPGKNPTPTKLETVSAKNENVSAKASISKKDENLQRQMEESAKKVTKGKSNVETFSPKVVSVTSLLEVLSKSKPSAPGVVSETTFVGTGGKMASISVLSSPASASAPAPVTEVHGNRLAELKNMESIILNRSNGLSTTPFNLNLRLMRGYCVGSAKDYSLEALHCCLQYLELPSTEKDSTEIKKAYLKSLLDIVSQKGPTNSSLLHPICTDAMKFLADALENHQINYLIKHFPPVIFENFEVLTGLKDYSFMTLAVYQNQMAYASASVFRSIDYLIICVFPLLSRRHQLTL